MNSALSSERVISVKNAIPAEIFPDLTVSLVAYLMYVNGQVPVMIDPAQPIANQTPLADRIHARQMRQFHASLTTCQDILAQIIKEFTSNLQESRAYITTSLIFGPSAAAPRRIFSFQLPISAYMDSPMPKPSVTVKDYMRVFSRELQQLDLALDRQPYRCYLLINEDAIFVASGTHSLAHLPAQAHSLGKCESRTVNSVRKVVDFYVVRLLLNSDTSLQAATQPSCLSTTKMRLMSSFRGFAAFADELDEAPNAD